MEDRRYGRVIVRHGPVPRERALAILRAAQEGCAVMRCEFLYHMDAWEFDAEHPDFDVYVQGVMAPEYIAVLDDPDGSTPRRARFEKR